LNPPRTEADWNEWWEHVFATVYWLNVRHDFGVDDFEIHNEPDNRSQGWGGSQADYFKLVKVAVDAIDHVYATYLPDRQFHIHAPKTTGGSRWPEAALAQIPRQFDSVNVHNYDGDISAYVRRVRGWMQRTIHARSPLWLGEWGTYTQGYDDLKFSLNLIKNMIRMSQPDTDVYGSHIFSLYDWGRDGNLVGLVNATGDRRLAYYAFRQGIRALQGGRKVLFSSRSADVMTIVTQAPDDPKKFAVLMVNDQAQSQRIMLDISALLTAGTGEIREFSATAKDEIVEKVAIEQGKIQFEIPAQASRLMMLSSPKQFPSQGFSTEADESSTLE
jgi:Glycosyl hydrolase catalytic core